MKEVHEKLLELVSSIANDSGTLECSEELDKVMVLIGATPDQCQEIYSLCGLLEFNSSEASCSPEEYNEHDWNDAFNKLVTILSTVMKIEMDEVSSFLEDDGHVSFPYEQWEEGLQDKEDDDDEE